MNGLDLFRRLWEHAVWADTEIRRALESLVSPLPEAVREYAHVLGAEEVWLSRLEGRAPSLAVWPVLEVGQLAATSERIASGYGAYLARLDDGALARPVAYTNSAGQAFETPIADILGQVMLHGQYHRGKINLLLRQSAAEPAPTDFISFARGVPAARTPVNDRR